MGYLIASCGHEISPDSKQFQISIADYDRDGDPCVNSLTVCKNCQNFYKMTNRILLTSQDEREWIENF